MRLKTLGLAALLATTAMVPTAAPARAAWPVDCVTGGAPPPQLRSVVRDSQGVHVYPQYLDEDIAALEAWAYGKTDAAYCIENGLLAGYAACLGAKGEEIAGSMNVEKAYFRYVRVSGGVHVYHPVLLEDLQACAP